MRNLLDTPRNSQPMEFSRTKRLENEQIERALKKIGLL
jgi:hypothetical protein